MNTKSKILAVDDSLVMQRIVSQTIETLGYEPVSASNGQEALSSLEQHGNNVALVLLDWNMTVMDGLETLRAIQADARFAAIPVMMVTTECEKQRVVEAAQLAPGRFGHHVHEFNARLGPGNDAFRSFAEAVSRPRARRAQGGAGRGSG